MIIMLLHLKLLNSIALNQFLFNILQYFHLNLMDPYYQYVIQLIFHYQLIIF